MGRKQAVSFSTLQIIGAAIVLLGVVIGLTFFLAPRKPEAPPKSEVSYQAPPQKEKKDSFEDNEPLPPPSALKKEKEKEATPPTETTDSENKGFDFFIRGQVLSGEEQGKALEGVTVTALSTAKPRGPLAEADHEEDVVRVETDGEGRYEIALRNPGIYIVTFTKNGFIPSEEKADPLDDEHKTAEINVTLSTGAKVSGRVTLTGTSEPAEGVTVRVDIDGGSQAKTDADGQYELSGLKPGEYGIALRLRGTEYIPGKTLPYQKIKIGRPDEHKEHVDFSVDAAGIVWGYVLDQNKTPVNDADVVICSSDSIFSQAINSAAKQQAPPSGHSDEEGYYEIKGVPLDQPWRIYATSKLSAPQLADPFIVTPTQRSVRIDIYLFSGSNVYGTVVSEKGEAIPEAEVICIPAYTKLLTPMESPQAFRNARSDDKGAFVLEQLPPGDYQVFAQKKNYKMALTGYPIYPDGYTNITGLTLELASSIDGDHSVYGTIVDATSMGVDGADVSLSGIGAMGMDASERSTSSAGGGQFRFDGVSPGYYTMEVRKAGYSPVTIRRVRLDDPIQVQLRQSATIRGVVLAKDTGKAPTSFVIDAYPLSEDGGKVNMLSMAGGPSNSMTFSAPDGAFELHLDAGAYRLEASADGYTPARTEITVETGQVMEGITLYLENDGGIIAGTVTASDGGNVQGATLTLVEAATAAEAMLMLQAAMGDNNRNQQIGSDGTFRFEDLPAGNYFVIAQHPNYANAQSDLIALAQQEKRENVQIRFGRGGGIEGYVYSAGQAVSGAVILLAGSGTTKNATTDENGYYHIDSLSAGVYQAMVTEISSGSLDSIYGARGLQVRVEEGQTTRCDFGAQNGATINGQCFPGPGNMLGGRAVLQMPGANPAPLGSMADLSQLMGQSTGISPTGNFTMEDVQPGEWQLDIYYFEFGGANPLQVRYVHTELVTVSGNEVIPLTLNVQY